MRYMVTFVFTQAFNAEMGALVQAEHARITELRDQGLVETGYLAADYSRGWVVMRGDSPEAATEAFSSLPMYKYMQIELTPMAEQNII